MIGIKWALCAFAVYGYCALSAAQSPEDKLEASNLGHVLRSNINTVAEGNNVKNDPQIFREERIAFTLALSLFGVALGSANLMNGLIGGSMSRQTMAEIKAQLNVIEEKVDQLQAGVNAILAGQAHLTNVVNYNDDIQRLEYLLHVFDRDISLVGDAFEPEDVALAWAEEVVSLSSDGMDQVLLNLHKMIMGGNVFAQNSILITFEAMLDRDSTSYSTQFIDFAEYTLALQASGYALWIYANTIKGRSVESIQAEHEERILEQNEFLFAVGAYWPAGSWGIPKPTSGCPANLGFQWNTGSRYHDCEDSNNANGWSSVHHFPTPNKAGINQNFCIKTAGGSGVWPSGSYCIFAKNGCPSGFSCGWIYWDDEDSRNNNQYSGTLPDGDYGRNTKIWYACRNDGSARNEITLPASKPFHMLRYESECQKVKNMKVTEEYLYWDNEDSGNADGSADPHPYEDGGSRNHKLHYCYYEPLLFTWSG